MKTILVDAVNVFVIKGEGIFNDMYNLLEWYTNKKIILTNANKEERENFWLNNLPYELFTLEHNPEKTDPRYYEMFLEKYCLSAEDIIYFEHNKDAVESARSIGIKTYHYDKDTKDLVKLKEFLDENIN